MSAGLVVASTMLGGTAQPWALWASAVLAAIGGTCAVVSLVVRGRQKAAKKTSATAQDTAEAQGKSKRTMGSLRTLTALLMTTLAAVGLLRSAASVIFWPEYERFHTCVEAALSDVTRAECQTVLQQDLQRRVDEVAGQ